MSIDRGSLQWRETMIVEGRGSRRRSISHASITAPSHTGRAYRIRRFHHAGPIHARPRRRARKKRDWKAAAHGRALAAGALIVEGLRRPGSFIWAPRPRPAVRPPRDRSKCLRGRLRVLPGADDEEQGAPRP